jgi:hypothetical protein
MTNRKINTKKVKLTEEQRDERHKRYEERILQNVDATKKLTAEQMAKSEAKIEKFIEERFTEYIPLKNHLQKWQMRNVLREHSRLTPASELSKYNLFTGGQGQTKEAMELIPGKSAGSCAKEETCVE